MLHFTKKRAVIAGAIATLAMGAVAFGFFTNTGSGTGSASVGASSEIAITQGAFSGAFYPAGPSRTATVTITNPGSGSQFVDTVHLASISTTATGCDTSTTGANPAFTMADIPVNADLAAGANTTRTATLQMNDTGVNQDTCQNAPLTLHFTSN